jgi:ammonia channel protein AmtB
MEMFAVHLFPGILGLVAVGLAAHEVRQTKQNKQ